MRQKLKSVKWQRKIRFFRRQVIWMPTFEGWIVTFVTLAIAITFFLTHIHPFLAVNAPIKADVLVVEGWVPDDTFPEVITEFNKGNYRKLITTGIPVELGFYLVKYKTFAEIAAATLIELGFNKENLIAVPGFEVKKHRTYAAAVALREWLAKSDLQINSINLYTYDAHARRSQLIFKQVLAPNIKVGVIAGKGHNFSSENWWKYSEGVRTVMSETIAYIYACFVDWRR